MKIDAIELEGFGAYREKERVELAGINLAAVIGPNHVGKSTIVSDALMFALYGVARGSSVNDIITRGEPKAIVTLEFTAQGVKYRITRHRTRKGRSEAALYIADPEAVGGWRDLTEKNPASANEQLLSILGMNAETARMTWMISQGDFGAFCALRPAPRRTVLAEAFNLGQYTALQKAAENKRDSLTRKLELASAEKARVTERVETLNEAGPFPMLDDTELDAAGQKAEQQAEEYARKLSNLDDPELQARLERARDAFNLFESSHRSALEQYRKTRAYHENAITQAQAAVRRWSGELSTAQDAQWQVKSSQEAVSTAQDKLRDAEQRVVTARQVVDDKAPLPGRLEVTLEQIGAQGKEISEQIDTLRTGIEKGEGSCYTCGQHLSAADAQLLIDAKLAQQNELRDRHRQVANERTEAMQAVATARTDVTRAENAVSQARADVRAAETNATRIESLAANAERLEAEVKAAQERLDAAQKELGEVGDPPVFDQVTHERLRADVTAAQKAVAEADQGAGRRDEYTAAATRAREESRRYWQEKQRRELVANELAELRPRLSELSKSVETFTADIDTHALLIEAFRPSGIPSMILAGVVEELNEDANDLLGQLGDDGLGVMVTTQREKARGGTEDKVNITAITPTGEADYFTLSGSEQFRVAIAIRLALAKCIARRTGSPVETIVMDEGWGALDEESKLAVQDVLTRLSAEFSVFTVSHIEDVRSAFPTVIDVSAASGTSRCTVRVGS